MVLSFVIDLKLERFLFLVSCFAWVIAVVELTFAWLHPPPGLGAQGRRVYRFFCILAMVLMLVGIIIPYRALFT